jgi:hypothetical protein
MEDFVQEDSEADPYELEEQSEEYEEPEQEELEEVQDYADDPEEGFEIDDGGEDDDLEEIEQEVKTRTRKRESATRRRMKEEQEQSLQDYLEGLQSDTPIRVTVGRLYPKIYRGQSISGMIETLDEPISEDDIKERYGGGMYELRIKQQDSKGRFVYKAARRVRIAGAPKLEGLIPEEEEQRSRARESDSVSQYALRMVEGQAERAYRMAEAERKISRESKNDGATDLLARELHLAREENSRKDAQMMELLERRGEGGRGIEMLFGKQIEGESARITAMRAQFDSETRTRNDTHRAEIDRIHARHEDALRRQDEQNQREIDALSRSLDKQTEIHKIETPRLHERFEDALRRQEDAAKREVDSLSRNLETQAFTHKTEIERLHERFEDALRRQEDAAKREVDLLSRNLETQAFTHKTEIERLHEHYKDTVESLKETQRREIESIKQSNDQRVESLKIAHEFVVDGLQREIKHIERDVETTKAEIVILREKKEKSLLDTLAEVSTVREALDSSFGGSGKEDQSSGGAGSAIERIVSGIFNSTLAEGVASRLAGVAASEAMQAAPRPQPRTMNPNPGIPVNQPVRLPDGQVVFKRQDGSFRKIQRKQPVLQPTGEEPTVPISDDEIKMAIQFMETALAGDTDPESFVRTAKNLAPAISSGPIREILETQGVDAFLARVDKLNPGSHLLSQHGKNWTRKVAAILLQ